MTKVDLYLGGDLGIWTLQNVSTEFIARVFTTDEVIANIAVSYNLAVETSNPNFIDFQPSEIGFSVHYPVIFKSEILSKYSKIYNLHPGYLPWGRGYYPIFWALWEETPAGATLHEINTGIDEGSIVAQTQVEYFPIDTGGSLFERVRKAEKDLFLENYKKIVNGEDIPAYHQAEGGSYHTKKDFFNFKQNANWESMNGRDLIKLIRCLTFPGYTGLEINLGSKKFELHFELLSMPRN
ncbi:MULTISPECIES: formyltransferase family protein [unclassified Microcoleus]|uniref:formyltransferase family protein n=1 Tax=unclassified Microcoleus TaxID=2642155 RepID=UPI002FD457B5